MTDPSDFSSHSHGEASSPEELFSLAKAHGESFPVLKAFQNYLDQERERARRRTMVLVLSFLGVVVALIVAFVVLFVSFFNVVLHNNEQQQVRILSLVTGEKPPAVAQPVPQVVVPQPVSAAQAVAQPEASAAEKPLTREDLLLLIRELKAQPEAPQPAPAAVAPQPEKKPAVSAPAKKTGVLSPVSKQEQMERLRKEEEERKARAAERKRRAEEEAAAKAALAAAERKTAEEAISAMAAPAPAPSVGERVQLKRRPGYGGNQVPKGKEADTIYLQTRSGVIPFRSVLPTTSADVYP